MLNVRIKGTDRIFSLDRITFSTENGNCFLLGSSHNENINLTIDYPLHVHSQYQPSDYTCVPFTTPIYAKEEDIFEVHVRNDMIGRIGWIFPIQALLSNLHKYAENKYYLRYAFVSFHKLLRGELLQEEIILEINSFEEQLSLADIYPTNLIVLVLSNEKTGDIPEFDIDNYLHSLYSYKYFYCISRADITTSIETKEDRQSKSIKLDEISKNLKREIFIKSLYKNHLTKKNHPLVQFHLLYQIIELLIDKVYDLEVHEIVTFAKNKTKTPYELAKKIKEASEEEYRFKQLCNKYLSSSISATTSLVHFSNELLRHVKKEKTDYVEAIYQVRNTLFHDYRTITTLTNYESIINNINSDFEKFVDGIINKFNAPESDYDHIPLNWLLYKLMFET